MSGYTTASMNRSSEACGRSQATSQLISNAKSHVGYSCEPVIDISRVEAYFPVRSGLTLFRLRLDDRAWFSTRAWDGSDARPCDLNSVTQNTHINVASWMSLAREREPLNRLQARTRYAYRNAGDNPPEITPPNCNPPGEQSPSWCTYHGDNSSGWQPRAPTGISVDHAVREFF